MQIVKLKDAGFRINSDFKIIMHLSMLLISKVEIFTLYN